MKLQTKSISLISVLKSLTFISLAAMSFNVFATNGMYVGNPTRPDTIVDPGHCANGCWQDTHYLKILTPITCRDVVWVDGGYDRSGNWIEAHYQLRNYRVVNSGSENNYAGYPSV